jgi:7-keto-8-aminopelargonate synthetase-like enzyme
MHRYGAATPQATVCAHSARTQDLHKQLEARISAFHGTEDTILFPSCFDANVRVSAKH